MYSFFHILPRTIVCICIRIYQKTLSFDHGFLKFLTPYGHCRYYPSCSEYGYQAINKYGVIKGGWKAFSRVLRCHPWAKGGNDPLL
ncbi:membrane protein insertion efficiency factor YidD [Candidatus Uhrbacteria bacterium RIFOXYA2_FULL_40_9]|nr:MAG: membrane protein insertion efficiency factor YidD [Candidatus Uhrbacteria bacterium RIFOXYA2_FULL_40_9]HBK35311.1 membrane protein insertion efficiency factor YidD [Candidatus Uhrbacteria bacterium]HCB55937.1 membrane protein insertion efficiency factor YidD [Candidatus Uhrbacteria bacterium]